MILQAFHLGGWGVSGVSYSRSVASTISSTTPTNRTRSALRAVANTASSTSSHTRIASRQRSVTTLAAHSSPLTVQRLTSRPIAASHATGATLTRSSTGQRVCSASIASAALVARTGLLQRSSSSAVSRGDSWQRTAIRQRTSASNTTSASSVTNTRRIQRSHTSTLSATSTLARSAQGYRILADGRTVQQSLYRSTSIARASAWNQLPALTAVRSHAASRTAALSILHATSVDRWETMWRTVQATISSLSLASVTQDLIRQHTSSLPHTVTYLRSHAGTRQIPITVAYELVVVQQSHQQRSTTATIINESDIHRQLLGSRDVYEQISSIDLILYGLQHQGEFIQNIAVALDHVSTSSRDTVLLRDLVDSVYASTQLHSLWNGSRSVSTANDVATFLLRYSDVVRTGQHAAAIESESTRDLAVSRHIEWLSAGLSQAEHRTAALRIIQSIQTHSPMISRAFPLVRAIASWTNIEVNGQQIRFLRRHAVMQQNAYSILSRFQSVQRIVFWARTHTASGLLSMVGDIIAGWLRASVHAKTRLVTDHRVVSRLHTWIMRRKN